MEARSLESTGRLRTLNLIGACWQEARGGQEGESINPATGREIGSFAAGAAIDAALAVDAARRAISTGTWSRDRQMRAALLLR